jgi:hypothetical protein
MMVRPHVFALIAFCILTQHPRHSLLAGLIVDPSGTTLFTGIWAERDTAKSVTGLNFNYYSRSVTEIMVAENGNLKFQDQGPDFFPTDLGASGSAARIAPMWDDFLMSESLNNVVRADVQSGSWLAVTWENVRLELETFATGSFPNTTTC